ncbi:hypothetical protein OPQ81_000964 [Rhizoctonia solani]|nr:hypothetical protein OPQ81_000964 [Rhizoctonia solani]
MFPFGRSPYAPTFSSYDPYEEMLLQQELQRRRQAEEYYRRRQLEELNRRRAEQLEYARRQAELQRRREAEARHRRQQELEARRRKFSEPSHARIPRVRIQPPTEQEDPRRQSMFDGDVQDLFDALYGNRSQPSPTPSYGRRSKSSDPRGRQQRVTPIWLSADASEPRDSAMSDTETVDEDVAPPASFTEPTGPETSNMTDGKTEQSNPEANQSHSAILNILKSFSDLKASFTFPGKIDFLNSPGDSDAVTPKLAYTPNNAPLHQYEHLLTGLLTKLDAVESYGQESIRKERKDAVRLIEQELEQLDVKKLQQWRDQFKQVPVVDTLPIPDVEMPGPVQGTDSETQAEVDPASIPLPHDEDPEHHSPTENSSSASSDSVATPIVQDSDLPPVPAEVEGERAAISEVNTDSMAQVDKDSTTDSVEKTKPTEETNLVEDTSSRADLGTDA